jgi:hypothetical protein
VKRVLITGSREFTDVAVARAGIASACWLLGPYYTIVHGAARGADRLIEKLALELDIPTEAHPADWETHGKRAGFIRNQAMVDAGADLCLAFLVAGQPCRGTRHCAGRAKAAGIPVRWYEQAAEIDRQAAQS